MKSTFAKCFLLMSFGFTSPISLADEIIRTDDSDKQTSSQSVRTVEPSQTLVASHSVWEVDSLHEDKKATAFFIEPNKIITALHVVWYAIQNSSVNQLYLTQENNSKIIKIKKILALSVEKDLALLETEESVSDYLPVREQTLDNLPEYLTLLGYPNEKFQVMKNVNQIYNINDRWLYFNVDYINLKGLSGGPMIDKQGQVLAVATEAHAGTIVVSVLRDFISNIEKFSCGSKLVKACFKESLDLLTQRAKEGNTLARYRLGFLYHEAYILKKNEEQAKRWLSLVAERGHPLAQYVLGVILRDQEDEKEQSMFWMKKAAKANYPPAQFELAMMIMKKGSRSWEEMMYWLRKAVDTNFAPALYYLGMLWKTEDDMKVSKDLFIQSAEIGFGPAQYEMGLINKAEGNIEEAIYWFQKSEEAGYLPAKEALAKIRREKNN